MSALDPSAPSQPSQQTGLNQSSNPASKTTTEEQTSQQPTSSTKVEQRVPSQHSQPAQPSALGSGDTGPLKERDISRSDAQGYSEDGNLEGEQMRATGEGEVADAVRRGGGGGHAEEMDLGADMERKREEHDDELKKRGQRTMEEIEEEEKEDWTGRKNGVDVGEALGGRGTKVVLAPEE
ncbi:MAG: hypothetical protein M1823_006732 [Watsoniomyces obsoletus]|nr:MAG: hypothetical protein M1823_006732 [Watsoniomyces obsoletus]